MTSSVCWVSHKCVGSQSKEAKKRYKALEPSHRMKLLCDIV